MKPYRRPILLGLITALITLADWIALGMGSNFGMNPALAIIGLLWLATLGLPASLGVVLVASIVSGKRATSPAPVRWR